MIKTEEALAMIGGHVDEELLLRNEYLTIKNEIPRKKVQGQIKLSQCDRICLATVGIVAYLLENRFNRLGVLSKNTFPRLCPRSSI